MEEAKRREGKGAADLGQKRDLGYIRTKRPTLKKQAELENRKRPRKSMS
jgi:hypothetical protein